MNGWGRCGERIKAAYEVGEEHALGMVERAVVVNLAWRANDDSRLAWPSQEMIRRDLGLARSTVEEALAKLRAFGLIERVRVRHGPGRGHQGEPGRGTTYRLTFLPEKTTGSRSSFEEKMTGSRQKMTGSRQKMTGNSAPDQHVWDTTPQEVLPVNSTPSSRNGSRVPAAVGAEVVEAGGSELLERLVAEVYAQRDPPPTSAQRPAIRRLARERLAVGWRPPVLLAALVATSAFTANAVDYAAKARAPDARQLSIAERSEAVILRHIRGGQR